MESALWRYGHETLQVVVNTAPTKVAVGDQLAW